MIYVTQYGPLTRYAKLWVAHATGLPETFSPPPRVSDPDMHHGTCVTHVPWCMPGSLTSGFLWSRWRGKRTRDFAYLVRGPCTSNIFPEVKAFAPLLRPCKCTWRSGPILSIVILRGSRLLSDMTSITKQIKPSANHCYIGIGSLSYILVILLVAKRPMKAGLNWWENNMRTVGGYAKSA